MMEEPSGFQVGAFGAQLRPRRGTGFQLRVSSTVPDLEPIGPTHEVDQSSECTMPGVRRTRSQPASPHETVARRTSLTGPSSGNSATDGTAATNFPASRNTVEPLMNLTFAALDPGIKSTKKSAVADSVVMLGA